MPNSNVASFVIFNSLFTHSLNTVLLLFDTVFSNMYLRLVCSCLSSKCSYSCTIITAILEQPNTFSDNNLSTITAGNNANYAAALGISGNIPRANGESESHRKGSKYLT
jgi:hypothetical protein